MNFYKRFMADYASKTARLTLAEHGAYNLLLDEFYTTERPLPSEISELFRICRAMKNSERAAVVSVSEKFFPIGPDGVRRNARAEHELAEATPAIQAARDNGKRGGRPRKTETQTKPTGFQNNNPDRNPNETQTKPSAKAPHSSELIQEKEKPPIPPKGAKSAIGLGEWLERVKAAGEKPFPDGCAVFVYAAGVGIPDDFLRLAWLEFKHRYSQPDAKRYKDWRTVFAKAVRGNWLKLWWLDGDAYSLTTAGAQAKRAHEDKAA